MEGGWNSACWEVSETLWLFRPGKKKKERVRAGGLVWSVLCQVLVVWHSPSLPAAEGCARSLGEQEAGGRRHETASALDPLHLD